MDGTSQDVQDIHISQAKDIGIRLDERTQQLQQRVREHDAVLSKLPADIDAAFAKIRSLEAMVGQIQRHDIAELRTALKVLTAAQVGQSLALTILIVIEWRRQN